MIGCDGASRMEGITGDSHTVPDRMDATVTLGVTEMVKIPNIVNLYSTQRGFQF